MHKMIVKLDSSSNSLYVLVHACVLVYQQQGDKTIPVIFIAPILLTYMEPTKRLTAMKLVYKCPY